MRFVTRDPASLDELISLRSARAQGLADYLHVELENGIADRVSQERTWSEARRHYYGQPANEVRDVPYLNASNRVAPLAQIAADAIFATVFAVTTEASPIVTVKASSDQWGDAAKAIQERIDHELNSEAEATTGGLHWNFLPSLYHGGKDCVKLGTGVWHVNWTEHLVKGKYARTERAGSRIEPVPLENILTPGGASYDLHNLPWVAIRHEMSGMELAEQARRQQWDTRYVHAQGNVSQQRQERERFSRQSGNATRTDVFDIYKVSCCYDIDGDGETEDLLAWYNHTGSSLLHVEWFPYDHRNIVMAHFDIEEFMLYGRGVPAILSSVTGIASDALNYWIDNEYLANCRMYKGPAGAIEGNTVLAYPGMYLASSNPEQISELRMSEVYPGMQALLQVAIGFGERATGINDLSTARPEQIPGRTPATTTMQMLSQVSQRHTPFFASFRSAAACLVRECLYREQERLLRGDTRLPEYLHKIMGQANAERYIQALTDPEFDNAIQVELTVTSAQMNKQVEQQNAMLVSNIYRQYVQEMVQAVMLASQPQTPQPLRDVLTKAIIASNEFMDKLLRTFSDVSDPRAFLIDPTAELKTMGQQAAANPMAQIAQMLGGQGGGAPSANGTIEASGVP